MEAARRMPCRGCLPGLPRSRRVGRPLGLIPAAARRPPAAWRPRALAAPQEEGPVLPPLRQLRPTPRRTPGMSMRPDRESGDKCYMVSARELTIMWGDWSWIPLADSRFSESAQLRIACWLDISGKIHSEMLSQGSVYAVYIVYKLTEDSYGLDSLDQDAWVSIGGTGITRQVCLQPDPQTTYAEDIVFPRERGDGWMEVELGEFVCEWGEDGDISFGLEEKNHLNAKSGLIIQGIEIRRKS